VKKSTRVEENFFRYRIHNLKIISLKGCLCLIALSFFMVGCTPTKGDETAPSISSATVEDTTITITATDDVGVTGYSVTDNTSTPSSTSNEWSTNPVITVDEEGTYFVWAKDNVGNVSNSEEVVINILSTFERLAVDYPHISWVLDTTETKTVDGVLYNLTELKQQYGDLYPIVEPLSEQEINDRWVYWVNYIVNKPTLDIFRGGLYRDNLGTDFFEQTKAFNFDWKESILTSTDPLLYRIGKNYKYSEKIDNYLINNYNDIFYSTQASDGVGLDIIDKISIENRELFIRNYYMEVYYTINKVYESGVEPRFYFDTELDN